MKQAFKYIPYPRSHREDVALPRLANKSGGGQTQMGTLVFGSRAALLGLFKCFEWPG